MEETAAPQDTPEALPEGRLQGRRAFADLVRAALATAAREGWPHIVLSDPDFEDWPLGERAVIESLNAWAGRGRRIQLLAHSYERLRLTHPRLVQWRVTWSHIVEAHACRQLSGNDLPSALWSPHWTMERIDIEHSVMVCSRAPEQRAALQERLEDCWQQGAPSFAATTLGL